MVSSLCVMKFGGTSVGDADCVRRAAAIVQSAAARGPVVVVVSAMSGVTNRLIQAAQGSEQGEQKFLSLVDQLRTQHSVAVEALVRDPQRRSSISDACNEVLAELERLLRGTSLLRELTPRALDAVSGIGERLSAPLVAGAITELGIRGVAVSATEFIVSDPHHGRAEPLMAPPRAKAEARLRPLLAQN